MYKKRITYLDGYDHYNKRRKRSIIVRLNEPEREYFRDAMAAMGKRNQSAFIRECIFGHIARSLTAAEKKRLTEVADWRAAAELKYKLEFQRN